MKKSTLLGLMALVGFGVSAAELPQLSTAENPTYYYLQNTRAQKMATFTAPGGSLTLETPAEQEADDYNKMWYFVAAEASDAPAGAIAATIHNRAVSGALVDVDSSSFSDEGITWYIIPNGDTFIISRTADASDNTSSWNDAGGFATHVSYWNGPDAGSQWVTKVSDDFDSTRLQMLNQRASTMLSQVNSYTAMGLYSQDDCDQFTAEYNRLAAIGFDTKETVDALAEAGDEIFGEGAVYARIFHAGETRVNQGISVAADRSSIQLSEQAVEENSQIFTIQYAGVNKFKLFMNHASRWIQQPAAFDTNPSLVDKVEDATIYGFSPATHDGTIFIGPVDGEDYEYWHSNNSSAICIWYECDNSEWTLKPANADLAATAQLEGAVAYHDYMALSISDLIGQYGYADATVVAEALAAAEAAATGENGDKIAAAAALIAAIDGQLQLNVLPCGFYRFHGVGDNSNRYMSSTLSETTHRPVIKVAEDVEKTPETIFYLDSIGHLVSYSTGLVIGGYLHNQTDTEKATWNLLDVTHENAGVLTIGVDTIGYTLDINENRFLYNANADLDCGGTPNLDGYHWEIENVDALPVAMDEIDGFSAIYSPVALGLASDEGQIAKAYIGHMNTKSEMEKHDVGNFIPANTPVILEYVAGVDSGYIYLPILEEAAQAETIENHLLGSIYATNKNADSTYFTVQMNGNEPAMISHDDDVLPGFTPHYIVSNEDEPWECYDIVEPVQTGISAIEASKADAIYDLQGRRVAKAVRGLYIINGVKTIVK